MLLIFWTERDFGITSDCKNSFNNKLKKFMNQQKISLTPQIHSLHLKNFLRKNVVRLLVYRNIPIIRTGRMYRHRTNLMGLYSGRGPYIRAAYIQEKKHFNLQSIKLIIFLSFFHIL